jgi:hypothetical protein
MRTHINYGEDGLQPHRRSPLLPTQLTTNTSSRTAPPHTHTHTHTHTHLLNCYSVQGMRSHAERLMKQSQSRTGASAPSHWARAAPHSFRSLPLPGCTFWFGSPLLRFALCSRDARADLLGGARWRCSRFASPSRSAFKRDGRGECACACACGVWLSIGHTSNVGKKSLPSWGISGRLSHDWDDTQHRARLRAMEGEC